MARGKPRRGGAGGRGGKGRGGGGAGGARTTNRDIVARPAISDIPASLHIKPSTEPIPAILVSALTEFKKAQSFFSGLEQLCPEFSANAEGTKQCWCGIPGSTITGISRDSESDFYAELELSDGKKAPIFVKRAHLLDCLNAMEGQYVWPEEGGLPASSGLWKAALGKINDPLNEAYVDAIFALVASKLVESDTSPHWVRCYGTFAARVDKYLYDISEEYGSLKNKPWWRRNQKHGLFKLHSDDKPPLESSAFQTMDSVALDDGDFETVDACGGGSSEEVAKPPANNIVNVSDGVSEVEPELSKEKSVKLSEPRLRLHRMKDSPSNSSELSGGDEEFSTDDEEEESAYAEFSNFPVQVSLLERAEGTLDELLDDEADDDETKEERWAAWLFQIIAALSTAQNLFGFVHNDLHTNNIMWSSTDLTHLYYRVHKGKESWIMKVPTYGKLMKIIDFGRASYHLPEPAGFFISDAFYPGNDACNQYNCDPFYDSDEGPRVEPNPSFDLCRLSVSLIESLYPERPPTAVPTKIMSREGAKIYTETASKVYNMLWEWLIDDEGKNVLRLPNGDERYPDFDLYKSIASDVHKAIPGKQFERPLFAGYKVSGSAPRDVKIYNLYM